MVAIRGRMLAKRRNARTGADLAVGRHRSSNMAITKVRKATKIMALGGSSRTTATSIQDRNLGRLLGRHRITMPRDPDKEDDRLTVVTIEEAI